MIDIMAVAEFGENVNFIGLLGGLLLVLASLLVPLALVIWGLALLFGAKQKADKKKQGRKILIIGLLLFVPYIVLRLIHVF